MMKHTGFTQKSSLFQSEIVVVFTVINHYMMQHIGLKRRLSLGVENTVRDGSTQKSLLYLSDVVDQNILFHTEVVVEFTVINHYMMQHIGLKRRVSLGVENLSVMKHTIYIYSFTQKSSLFPSYVVDPGFAQA